MAEGTELPVVVTTSYPIPHVGGASTHIETLLRALSDLDRLAGLVSGEEDLGRSRRLRKGISALRGRDQGRVRSLKSAVSHLASRLEAVLPPDRRAVIHAHDPLASAAALSIARATTTVVQTVHGPWSKEVASHGFNPASAYVQTINELEAKVFASVDALIAVDHGQAAILVDDFSVPRSAVTVVPNAVDIGRLEALARQRGLPRPSSAPYFVVPRRLVPKNGVEVALRSLQLIQRDVDLVVAGDGPLRGELERLARDLGVDRRVHFVGSLSHAELLPLLADSAGCLVPSVPVDGVIEATSLAVLEAMAVGVIVIGSRIGGIAEIIRDGEGGRLAEPGDPSHWAQVISEVLAMSPAQRAVIGEAATDRVRAAYSVDHWINRTVAVYDSASGAKGQQDDC